MLAASNTAFQTPPSLTSVPWVSNGGVVGSVMPSASPTAASDGPASLKRPFRPVKWSGSSGAAVEVDAGVRPMMRAQRQRLRLRVGAFGEEAEHAGGAQVDSNRQLPVLADRLQAQAAFAGREAHAVGDLRRAAAAPPARMTMPLLAAPLAAAGAGAEAAPLRGRGPLAGAPASPPRRCRR